MSTNTVTTEARLTGAGHTNFSESDPGPTLVRTFSCVHTWHTHGIWPAESGLLPVIINTGLLEHSHTPAGMVCGCF